MSLAVVGLAISLIFAMFDLARYLPKIHPVLTDVIALFSLLSISLLWTDPPGEYGAEKATKLLTSTLLSALVVLIVRDRRDLASMAIVWPFVMLPIALVSLAGFEGGRATGFDSNPIWVARALSTGLIFMTWRVWSTSEKPSLLVILSVPTVLFSALILTGSRGPIVGLFAGILVLSLFGAKGRLMRVTSIVLGATLMGFFIFFTDFFSTSRIVESVSEGELFDSSGRDELLPVALSVIREHPWGVGFGNISNYWTERYDYPHNIFIEVMAEHGLLIGAIFTLVTLVTLVMLLVKARRDQHGLLLAALLSAEIMNVSFSGDLNARTFFFFLTLSIWFLHWSKRHRRGETNRSTWNKADHRLAA